MAEPLEVKVGDKLFVKGGYYDRGHIEVVERLTPTGRIVTKSAQYDADGWMRGQQRGWGRTQARKATEDDIAGIFRLGLVRKIEQFRVWDKLSADDLKAVAEIVGKYQLPAQ